MKVGNVSRMFHVHLTKALDLQVHKVLAHELVRIYLVYLLASLKLHPQHTIVRR